MLVTKELDTNKARLAYFAHMDAVRRSANAESFYSNAQRKQARTIADLLDLMYVNKNVYVTYRKNFIAVKVDAAIVRNKKGAKEVDSIIESKGYTKVITPQGLIVRIPKA